MLIGQNTFRDGDEVGIAVCSSDIFFLLELMHEKRILLNKTNGVPPLLMVEMLAAVELG